VVVYAGSLVNREILKFAKPGAEVYDSSILTTEEIVEILARKAAEGKLVVRLKSGDSGIYGALWEEMLPLLQMGIEVEVVPDVTAALAAAAGADLLCYITPAEHLALPTVEQVEGGKGLQSGGPHRGHRQAREEGLQMGPGGQHLPREAPMERDDTAVDRPRGGVAGLHTVRHPRDQRLHHVRRLLPYDVGNATGKSHGVAEAGFYSYKSSI
jgi:hypothetical protein